MEFRKFCSWFDLTKYNLSEFERFWYNCVCCASCFYFKMCYNQDEKQKPSLLTWLKCKMWTDKRLLLRSQATVVFQMRLRGDCGHWMQMLIMVMELILDIRTTILILESSKVSRVPRILYFYILRFIKKKKKIYSIDGISIFIIESGEKVESYRSQITVTFEIIIENRWND